MTTNAKETFHQLWWAFIKALIFQYFNLDQHIQIKTEAFGYIIDGVLSQLASDDLGQWHLIPHFSQKIIPVETWYKIHDRELLAIIKIFKI